MKIDFHVHTIYSKDSANQLDEIIKLYSKKRIVPAITDHNTIIAHEKLRKKGFKFIPGEEISTNKGDLIALNITEEIKKGIDYYEALDLIKEQGAISYAPHPFDNIRKGVGDLAKDAQIIETFNARSFYSQNKQSEQKAREWKKITAGGSDAHYNIEIGKVYVEIDEIDLENNKEILRALAKGKIIGKYTNPCIARCTAGFVKIAKKIGIIKIKD